MPVRGAYPSRQALGGEGVSGAGNGTDQVEVQDLDEAFAHFDGTGRGIRGIALTTRRTCRNIAAPYRYLEAP